jgi:aldehyde:ferredoxin oxidoreductase
LEQGIRCYPKNADKEGPIAGKVLEYDKYIQSLDHYYDIRGWDQRGIPTKQIIKKLGLEEESENLEDYVSLE